MNPQLFHDMNHIKEIIHHHWQTILAIDINDSTVNFFTLGGNSIQAMSIISLINDSLKLNLTLADFFDTLTIEKMSLLVMQQLNLLCA